MTKRNRGTMALSVEGVQIVRTAVYQQGWTQRLWAEKGYTSVSTVKRLLNGNSVEAHCFYSLLQALDLEVQDSYICKQTGSVQSLLLSPREILSSQHQPGVFMTATFTEDKRPQIERAMRHLQELLIDGEVVFSENRGAVTVSGDFCENSREHIRMTIAQLERLFTSCRVTW
jgi:hypothetical protein